MNKFVVHYLNIRIDILTGGLIVGLNLAVSTMRVGELSRIIIRPQYAFGEMGTPPRIPKDATGVLKWLSLIYL